MADPFDKLIVEARAFYTELASQNTREWFQANKARFEAEIKGPAALLADGMAHRLGKMTGKPMTAKIFRPHRDVRFSKDKTPYHTHLHIMWRHGAEETGYFFGVSPEYVTCGAGNMGMQGAALNTFRTAIDQRGDVLEAAITALVAKGFRLDDPALKRVPAPYSKEHPHGKLLRRKSLALWLDQDPEAELESLQEILLGVFAELKPLTDWLSAGQRS